MKLPRTIMIMSVLYLGLLLGCTEQSTLTQTSPTTQGEKIMNTSGFAIHIFDIATIGGIGETKETSWFVLKNVPLENSTYTVTEKILLDYNWETQTFAIPNQWGENSLDSPGVMWSGEGAFLVTFNGQRLFGGRIVQAISPRRFEFPAMALSLPSIKNDPVSQGKLIYSFHPTSSVLYEPQPTFLADDPAMGEMVRQHLAAIGKLK